MRLLLLVCSISALFAQVDAGGVSGVITDRTGAVIPGAKITIRHIDTNVSAELTTNAAGFYAAPSLRPGRYEIRVVHEGFRPQKSQPFDLRVQDRAELSFQLEVGATTSEVTITATAPLLESETSSLGQVVEEKTITNLPLNGRNFMQLATLGPGRYLRRAPPNAIPLSPMGRAGCRTAICSTASTTATASLGSTRVRRRSCSP